MASFETKEEEMSVIPMNAFCIRSIQNKLSEEQGRSEKATEQAEVANCPNWPTDVNIKASDYNVSVNLSVKPSMSGMCSF